MSKGIWTKSVATMAAVSALCIAAPASAQDSSFNQRVEQLNDRLQAGIRSREITRDEATRLRERLRQLIQLERQYSQNGFTRAERERLQQGIEQLREQIRRAATNQNDRPGADRPGSNAFDQQIQTLRERIRAGVQRGTITRVEAEVLRDRLNRLIRLEREYSQGGFTRTERERLGQGIERLREQIRRAERNDRDDDDADRPGNGRDCPPGLAKKNNGCQPPGQAKKDRDDDRYNERDRDDRKYGKKERDDD